MMADYVCIIKYARKDIPQKLLHSAEIGDFLPIKQIRIRLTSNMVLYTIPLVLIFSDS
jgi:hypothetical protein